MDGGESRGGDQGKEAVPGGGGAGVSRAHRAAQPEAARLHHRGCGGSDPARASIGRGAAPRSPPRCSARVQGSLRREGTPHLLWHANPGLLSVRARLHGGGAAVTGGRGNARQAQHERAGHGPLWRQCPSRRCPEPVAARPYHGRLLEWVSRSGGCSFVRGRTRQRHRRLHQTARGGVRHRRSQAHVWASEPRGGDGAVVVLRSPWSHDPDRAGLRAPPRRHRRARPGGRHRELTRRAGLPGCARRSRARDAHRRARELLLRRAAPRGRQGGEGSHHRSRGTGTRVETLRVPDPEPMVAACNNMMVSAEAASIHSRILKERPGELQPAVLARLAPGLRVSAYDYIQGSRLRAQLTREFIADVFSTVDVLVAPTIPEPAPTLAEAKAGTTEDVVRRMGQFSRLTRPFNALGLPALSVPCGAAPDGRPLAMQLVGRPFDEATLLRLGDAYERATPWHRRRPALP